MRRIILGSVAGTFKEKFDSIKGTKKGILISLGLILGINTLILFFPLGDCLILFLPPLIIFGIQYLFGERKMKMFILVGLIAIFLTCLILPFPSLYNIYNATDHPSFDGRASDGTLVLENGRVNPISYTESGVYNYTVTYIDPGGLPKNITVNIFSFYLGVNETHHMKPVDQSIDTAGGKEYYFEKELAESIYYFSFSTTNSTDVDAITSGTYGNYELGPIHLSLTTVILNGLSLVPFLAMIYLLFILLYWWTQKAKTYQPPAPKEEPKEEEEFTCSKCGADVPGDATKCPKCGEAFEEDEEEEKPKEAAMESKADMGYCRVCNRRVVKGDMMLGCQCGRAYHLKCANQVGKCPACGTEFN